MSTLADYLSQITERVERATPGPYDARVREFSNSALCEVWTEFGWYSQLPREYREPTTELFVSAPTDLARLVAIVRELEAALERIEASRGTNAGSVNASNYHTARAALQRVAELVKENT